MSRIDCCPPDEVLARAGRPPFVLTVDNAKAYINPFTLITKKRKRSLALLFEMPRLKRNFAEFLMAQENPDFLQPGRDRTEEAL